MKAYGAIYVEGVLTLETDQLDEEYCLLWLRESDLISSAVDKDKIDWIIWFTCAYFEQSCT